MSKTHNPSSFLFNYIVRLLISLSQYRYMEIQMLQVEQTLYDRYPHT